VAAARNAGDARLVIGGDCLSGLDEGWFFDPTIFDVTDQSCAIAHEEVFGPVLTIFPFPRRASGRAPREQLQLRPRGNFCVRFIGVAGGLAPDARPRPRRLPDARVRAAAPRQWRRGMHFRCQNPQRDQSQPGSPTAKFRSKGLSVSVSRHGRAASVTPFRNRARDGGMRVAWIDSGSAQ
jgi:hypothetical protein